LRINQKRRYSDGSLEKIKTRLKDWTRILEDYNLDSKMNKHEQWCFKIGLVGEWDPPSYEDYRHGWLNQKHRILLYPSAAEEKFQERKRANPVPHGFGPSGIEKDPYFKKRKYKWTKGMGQFETNNSFNSVYPVRLYYPKSQTNLKHGSVVAPKKEKPKNWKRAKYNIPDPVWEIKAKGINAAHTLYSGSGVHISTQTGWMRDLMNSYLVQNRHFKQNPPKEYHSKRKWISQMRDIWDKHKLRDESEQNKRMIRRREFASTQNLRRGHSEFVKSNRQSKASERSPQKTEFRSKLKYKEHFGRRRTASRRSRSAHDLKHELGRNKSYETKERKKKENEKNEIPENKDNLQSSPKVLNQKSRLPVSEALLLSMGGRAKTK